MKKGKLILIPCTLGPTEIAAVIPSENIHHINTCQSFIVENLRSARRFLKKAGLKSDLNDLSFHLLNKHTSVNDFSTMLENCFNGQNVGLISEAGCPGIADPGAEIVKLAHSKNIIVQPLVGPSSILLALMASGMNGQNFAFNGYLPKDQSERIKKIQFLEHLSYKNNQTQIFIETPYRNSHLIQDLGHHCHPNTYIAIATDLTTETQQIICQQAKELKKQNLQLKKRPTVFLIHKY